MLVTQQPVLRRFWYALMPVSMLADGPKPFTLLSERLVLFMGKEGPVALADRCCHRTAQLSKGWVDDGVIVCGYHGWRYDQSGACVCIPQQADNAPIPAGARTDAYHCQEKYGYVWVCLGEEGQPQYRRIFQFYEEWQTSPLRFMENSFDNSHFSFVHKANFGMLSQPKPSKYLLEQNEWGFEAETIVPINNPAAGHRVTGTDAPTTTRHLFNRWHLPFVRRFGCTYPDSGLHHIIYNCATPIDDKRIQLVQWLYRNDSEEACSTEELIAWDAPITLEDKEILEATDYDACVDTRRRVEFHMESDKPGLIMRKMLFELLQKHGEEEQFRPAGVPL
jgi:phenylpropionate dioxygenase-like ring-hydroxylating dioxygenase large terminal subunit